MVLSVLEELGVAAGGAATILHAGCGTSKIGLELAERGHAVINVDYSETAVQLMRGVHAGADYRCEDCRSMLSVGPDSVDLVLDKGTYDSMTANSETRAENARRLTEEFRRVLKVGGRLLIFSSFGPEAEKDMMTILRADGMDIACRVVEAAPHEYPDDDHSYLYTLVKVAPAGAEEAEPGEAGAAGAEVPPSGPSPAQDGAGEGHDTL